MIQYKLYDLVKDLPEEWDSLDVQDVFLKRPFLNALEQSSPNNISTYYVAVFSSDELVGVAVIQRVQMYLDDVFRKTSNTVFKRFGKWLISKIVKGNALIVGNLMHTGQHGMGFNAHKITQTDYLGMISEALAELSKTIKLKFKKNIRIITFKDYFEEDSIHARTTFFKRQALFKTKVQPNMIFDIKPEWNAPDDYISSFNKKYRRRYKTARKKSATIKKRELNLEDIERFSETIYRLYENVSDNAGVNSFKLHRDHFYQLKYQLQTNFRLYGYFLEEELVGFFSLIHNYDKLETYFLGYRQDLQHQHQMYLNMLFDMASYGIENDHNQVVFARTAMEIKSSIGAKPHDMYIYLKHTNSIVANTTLKLIVKYANPVREWEERHPYKV